MPKVFLTGATGFIGGDLLHLLTHKHPDWRITCIVRNEVKSRLVAASYPHVRLVLGDNNSSSLLEDEASNADIIYHTSASDDDVPSAQAIARGLARNPNAHTYWIHTSGGLILARESTATSAYGQRFDKVFDDDENIQELIRTMPDDAPHREVDKIVLNAGSDSVKTAIVCPTVVYGVGRGPDKKHSWPIWSSCMKYGGVFAVGKGENIWHYVHVRDLSELYVLLGEAAVGGSESMLWNEGGYYIAENGSYVVKEMLTAAAKIGVEKGYWPKGEVEYLAPEQADKLMPRSSLVLGANSRGRGLRAKKLLGWSPSMPKFEDSMVDVMELEAEEIGFGK